MTKRSASRKRGSRVRPQPLPTTRPPTAVPLGYRPSLDGLRAIAVLGVMSWHYVLPGVKGGFLGVDIFFVLSGFLITKLLVEEWDATGGIHLGRFYLRRMLRLFPALFLLLLVTLPIVPRIWTWYSLLYVTNWGLLAQKLGPSAIMQLWSLSVEEQFYIVWPPVLLGMLALRTPRKLIITVVALLATASAAFKVVGWHSMDDWSRFYFGFHSRADELLIGCLLALFLSWSRLPGKAWFQMSVKVATIPAVIWLGYLIVSAAVYWELLYHQGGVTWVALATAVVILQIMIAPFQWMRAILAWPPMVQIGRMSYGLYLWHSPVAWMTDPRRYEWIPVMSRPVQFVVRVALTFLVAGLSYHLMERPLLRLKHRFSAIESGDAKAGPPGVE
jgi:peptidoglycan/LPS O-acetylase OafA/YrhL